MALINTPPTIAPATAAVTTLRTNITNTYNTLLQSYLQGYNLVWRNPKATPDLVVAAMGVDAVQLFEVSALTAQLLTALGATVPLTMPTGWIFVANTDGSVTLTKATI
jgi:hypothetical protein